MNKTEVKNFTVWAREKLVTDIRYEAARRSISEKGIAEHFLQLTKDLHFFDISTKNDAEVSGVEIKQREVLVNAIKRKEHRT